MKHFTYLILIILLFPFHAYTENISGLFRTETSDKGGYLIVEMGPCQKNKNLTCGVIKDALWEDNSSQIYYYEHLNKPIVWDMKNISPQEFKKGKIWKSIDNKTFNSKMEVEEVNLKVSGCILLLCSSQVWQKIK